MLPARLDDRCPEAGGDGLIRTILVSRGAAHLHVGGGVVADSTASGEYRESLDKAVALLDALERSGSVS